MAVANETSKLLLTRNQTDGYSTTDTPCIIYAFIGEENTTKGTSSEQSVERNIIVLVTHLFGFLGMGWSFHVSVAGINQVPFLTQFP